jgi:MOSC domain-containing protein
VSTVARLAITHVKATRLREVESVTLGPSGAEGNRRFYLIDERGRMVNGKVVGELQAVIASLGDGKLTLTFPDNRVIEGPVSAGAPVQTTFFSDPREARLVEGPWSEALSDLVGRPLRLVDANGVGAVDRGAEGAVSLISRASLNRLAAQAQVPEVDSRRFRMLIELDGLDAHEEDGWIGRRSRVGEAVIEWGGHVGRCLITSRDPDSGRIDLPTLDLLRDYRGDLAATEPLPFGIYGSVVEPGVVRIGDRVTLQ